MAASLWCGEREPGEANHHRRFGDAVSGLGTIARIWNRATGSKRNTFAALRLWHTVRPELTIRPTRSIFSKSTTAMHTKNCNIWLLWEFIRRPWCQAEPSKQRCVQGKMPVNVSGGSLGIGHTLEASGLYRLAEIVCQLRGEAGPRQLPRAKVGLAQSWRGVPTTSGAVVIVGVE